MPEWLTHSVPATTLAPEVLAVRLVLSVVFGSVVGAIYRVSHGRGKTDGGALTTTLVLLCVLTAMVSVVIGDSVARAFGLVGALSIVRFRAVVDDTRDTAFVICAVIVGMAVGAGLILLPVIGLPIVALVACGLDRFGRARTLSTSESTLSLRFGLGRDPETLTRDIFQRRLSQHRVISAGTARQGAALDVVYAVHLRSELDVTGLVSELNQIEGIQSVELKQPWGEKD